MRVESAPLDCGLRWVRALCAGRTLMCAGLTLLGAACSSGGGEDGVPGPPAGTGPPAQGQMGPPAFACPPADEVAAESLLHAAALLSGTTQVEKLGSEWRFAFAHDGDSPYAVEYRIDLADPLVAGGVLRVRELASDAFPLERGGAWLRRAGGGQLDPLELAASTALVAEEPLVDGVAFEFESQVDGATHRQRHEWRLQGGSLRVRVRSLDTANTSPLGNFAGLDAGPTAGTENVQHLRFQGVLATPTFAYEGPGGAWFLGVQLDLLQSRASDWRLPDADALPSGGDSHAFAYTTVDEYEPDTAGQLVATLDETLSIAVAPRLAPVLVRPSRAASPYRGLLTRRTFGLLGQPKSWAFWDARLSELAQLGAEQLLWFTHAWWTASAKEGAQNVGPDWFPASDASGLAATLAHTRGLGQLGGLYCFFGLMPQSSPSYNPAHLALDPNGAVQSWNGFPLTAEDTTRVQALAEAKLLAENYAPTAIYADVQTYASPSRGAAGDSIDQRADSAYAQTNRDAILTRKRWLSELGTAIGGPVLGEASQVHQDANMEWLWLGACDAVARTINTGVGVQVGQVPAGDPRAVTNWPIVPEFEQRVFAPLSVPHGNGPFLRFFGPNDQPLASNPPGQPAPLSDALLDRWRTYELSYAHAGHFQSTGNVDTLKDYVSTRQILLETFLVGALQESYLNAELSSIRYRHGGSLRSFEEVWESTGSLDAFRDAQLELRYDDGLVLWANHASVPWTVQANGQSFVLPEDGFLGWRPSDGLLAFSARPPGASARADYAFSPGRYELLDGRGQALAFGGLSSPGRLVLHEFARGLLVEEQFGDQFTRTELGAPALLRVRLEPEQVVVAPGERVGFLAWAEYEGGVRREVTARVGWDLSNGTVARIDLGAVLTGCVEGAVELGGQALGLPIEPATVVVAAP